MEIEAISGRSKAILLTAGTATACLEATSPVPAGDELLASKLLLEIDEHRFLATAHRFHYR